MNQQESVVVHMVGNAHIDPVWLWPMQEGRDEVLSTYHTAISLIEEMDGYVFSSGGAVTYQWVAEDDPALFRAIQRAVLERRWVLVNGWWIQPDCNIPHGESFARHALYGQRFLLEHFRRRAVVGYNVDSFGHAGTLPQLLELGGLHAYVFFRPGPHEKDLPRGPYWWEAPGGARVLTCRPPLHYGSPGDVDMVARVTAAAAEAPEGFPVVMCFYGVGNHGGGPTRRNVQEIAAFAQGNTAIRPVFSSPDAFFQEARAHSDAWPVVHDELQHHSRGCYTALSRVKRENRQAEHALMRAERLATLAAVLCGAPDPRESLETAWRGVLFNQFHDILAGTSLRDAYEDVWDLYDVAQRTCARLESEALRALGDQIALPEREGQQAALVWNPSPWPRREVARLSLPLGPWRRDFAGQHYPAAPVVEDGQGRVLPSQIAAVRFDYNTYMVDLDVQVDAPALGAAALYLRLGDTTPPTEEPRPPLANSLDDGQLFPALLETVGGPLDPLRLAPRRVGVAEPPGRFP